MKPTHKTAWRTTLLAAVGLVALAWAASLLIASSAFAQADGAAPRSGQGQRQGPPPEALAACKSLASGASCSFTGRRGAETGSCFAPQPDLALACRPKDAPPPEGAASAPRR